MYISRFYLMTALLLLISYGGSASGSKILSAAEQKIYEVFSGKIKIQSEKYFLPTEISNQIQNDARQAFYNDFIYIFRVYQADSLLGTAILDNVPGKSLPITFLVIFDISGKILKSEIIAYREPYGGAVSGEAWNGQFIGKDADSNYRIGDEIQGISGATISVRSVTKGIQKSALLIRKIIENK